MIILKNRGIIEISGADAETFLNNLLTNDVAKIGEDSAQFSALLTPQGKFLFDIFIYKVNDNSFLLDAPFADELFQKLRMYKLRANVEIMPRDDLGVYASFDICCHPALDAGSACQNEGQPLKEIPQQVRDDNYYPFIDPRNSALGFRVFAPKDIAANTDYAEYENLRLSLGIPELSEDLIREQDFALEGLLDELGAIDFQKGCYVGQEMTSRMKRRGTLKQKLCRFRAKSKTPFGAPIMADALEIGQIRTNNGEFGMALLRFDRWQGAVQNGQTLLASEQEITIEPPNWIII